MPMIKRMVLSSTIVKPRARLRRSRMVRAVIEDISPPVHRKSDATPGPRQTPGFFGGRAHQVQTRAALDVQVVGPVARIAQRPEGRCLRYVTTYAITPPAQPRSARMARTLK